MDLPRTPIQTKNGHAHARTKPTIYKCGKQMRKNQFHVENRNSMEFLRVPWLPFLSVFPHLSKLFSPTFNYLSDCSCSWRVLVSNRVVAIFLFVANIESWRTTTETISIVSRAKMRLICWAILVQFTNSTRCRRSKWCGGSASKSCSYWVGFWRHSIWNMYTFPFQLLMRLKWINREPTILHSYM